MEFILETKAATILQFFAGLRGTLSVTFEEGTWAAWLYALRAQFSVRAPWPTWNWLAPMLSEHRITARPLDTETPLDIAIQIADGLDAAHGVVGPLWMTSQ